MLIVPRTTYRRKPSSRNGEWIKLVDRINMYWICSWSKSFDCLTTNYTLSTASILEGTLFIHTAAYLQYVGTLANIIRLVMIHDIPCHPVNPTELWPRNCNDCTYQLFQAQKVPFKSRNATKYSNVSRWHDVNAENRTFCQPFTARTCAAQVVAQNLKLAVHTCMSMLETVLAFHLHLHHWITYHSLN